MASWAVRLCLIVAIVHTTVGASEELQNPKLAELHHRMTKREIHQYFGVDSHDKVPEYEVTTPFQSDHKGDFLSYKLHQKTPTRHRRSTGHHNAWYLSIQALGLDINLNLTQTSGPSHASLVVATNHENGTTTYADPPKTQHYQGHVVSAPGSMVAISNNRGLTGMISLLDQLLFVHPVPNHLAEDYKSPGGGQPHVVYRHPAGDAAADKRSACEMKETMSRGNVRNSRYRRSANDNHPITSGHKILEVAMVADQYVTESQGEEKMADILLMLAHIVDRLFQDESAGKTKIQLVVTKLVIHKEGFGYKTDDSKMVKLARSSEWGVRNLSLDPGKRGHADALVLITANTKGGLAKVSSTCTSQFGRTVSGYLGLGTALIIAHELAHTMGVRHDGRRPDCPGESFLMSAAVPGGKKALTWSPCSREDLQEFLSGSSSSCLDDYPAEEGVVRMPKRFHNELPGQVYDGTVQCQMLYGPKYYHCKQLQSNCGSLYCSKNGLTCVSYRTPPMDGTRCGVRHWCISGECVDDGSPMIDGGWSDWSEYSQCSRPCDGGLQWKSRTCTNPTAQAGGKECEGSTKGFWKICNTQACPKPTKSLRQEQCEAANKEFRIYWDSDPCRLTCIKGSIKYMYGRVKDGVRCSSDKFNRDVCIEGRCRSVGCDGVLQSGVKYDRCGVCGGDSSSCTIVIGEYTKHWRGYGPWNPDKIIEIPKGAANVLVTMRAKTSHLLGVQNNKGQWVYNVGYTWSTVVPAAGTKVAYDHEDYLYKDKVIIRGPTEQPLFIMYVSLGHNNPGVLYKFSSPKPSNVTSDDVQWNVTSWSACSEPCAGGFQSRSVECLRKDDWSWVNERLCKKNSDKPTAEQRCNQKPCPAKWHESGWRPCSQTCGKGVQLRHVICHRKVSMTTYQTRPEAECKGSEKPQVAGQRACNLVDCPVEWVPSKWSHCSASCGPDGATKRTLGCKRLTQNGAYEPVPRILCKHAAKPSTDEPCNTDISCPNTFTTPEGKKFVQLGCYRDYQGYHALPKLVANLRNKIDWYQMNKTVEECAEKVVQKNNTFTVFGVQFYGECWSGERAEQTYAEYGSSKNCWEGVGGAHTNFVYTFV